MLAAGRKSQSADDVCATKWTCVATPARTLDVENDEPILLISDALADELIES